MDTAGSCITEAHIKPRDSTRQRRLPPLCPSPKREENNIERRSMDDRSDQEGTTHILGLSTADRKTLEAHAKPRDSTRQRRLLPLCPSPRRTRNHIERRSMDDRSDLEGTTATS